MKRLPEEQNLGWILFLSLNVLVQASRMGPGGHYCLIRSSSLQTVPSDASAVLELQASPRPEDVVGKSPVMSIPLLSVVENSVPTSAPSGLSCTLSMLTRSLFLLLRWGAGLLGLETVC